MKLKGAIPAALFCPAHVAPHSVNKSSAAGFDSGVLTLSRGAAPLLAPCSLELSSPVAFGVCVRFPSAPHRQ